MAGDKQPSLTSLPFQVLLRIASQIASPHVLSITPSPSLLSDNRQQPLPVDLLHFAQSSQLCALAVAIQWKTRVCALSPRVERQHFTDWVNAVGPFIPSLEMHQICDIFIETKRNGYGKKSTENVLVRITTYLMRLPVVSLKVLDLGESAFNLLHSCRPPYFEFGHTSPHGKFCMEFISTLSSFQRTLTALSIANSPSCLHCFQAFGYSFSRLTSLTVYLLPSINFPITPVLTRLLQHCIPPSQLPNISHLDLVGLADLTAADIALCPSLSSLFTSVKTMHVAVFRPDFHLSHIISGLITRFVNLHELSLQGALTTEACDSIREMQALHSIKLQPKPMPSSLANGYLHSEEELNVVAGEMVQSFGEKLKSLSYPVDRYLKIHSISTVPNMTQLRYLVIPIDCGHIDPLVTIVQRNQQLKRLGLILFMSAPRTLFGDAGWEKLAAVICQHNTLECVVLDDGNAGYLLEDSCDGERFPFITLSEQLAFLSTVTQIISTIGHRLKLLEVRIILSDSRFQTSADVLLTILERIVLCQCPKLKELVVLTRMTRQCSTWKWTWMDGVDEEAHCRFKETVNRMERLRRSALETCQQLVRVDDGGLIQMARDYADEVKQEFEDTKQQFDLFSDL